jgi:hypothetical protein
MNRSLLFEHCRTRTKLPQMLKAAERNHSVPTGLLSDLGFVSGLVEPVTDGSIGDLQLVGNLHPLHALGSH